MEIKKRTAAGAALALFALVMAAKDPVIMTVNGVDVPKSEFEYLYGKNSQQQLTRQPLEEYVEMFKLYKLKVADAKAEGIDTTAAFRKEIEQYRHDLAAPYLADSVFLNKLLDEEHARMMEEVQTRHIMLFKKPSMKENKTVRARIDSIRGALLSGADFADMARRFSEDRGSSANGGLMGWITGRQYPYYFEVAAYSTPEGEISEVVESPVGFHILLGGKHRPARGKVQAAHILKMARQEDQAADAKAKAEIDSIYRIVKANPEAFSDMATRLSDDKGSARQGGLLPWFGTGEMVAEFDSVAFAIPDNSISEPFRTAFGWHIVKKTGTRPVPSVESIKPEFLARVGSPQDQRFALIKRNQTERLAKTHKSKLNKKTLGELKNAVAVNGLDSLFYSRFGGMQGATELFTVDGVATPVSTLLGGMHEVFQTDPAIAGQLLDDAIENLYGNKLVEAEEARLGREVSDYRNLLNEYVDGSLLYEVSVRKIWDKAAKDTEGLQNYFNTHRDDYKWSEPHAKGYLVQAINDSVAAEIRNLATRTGRDSLVNTVRKTFGNKVHIEKVLAEKGNNAMVDNILFGGPETKPSKRNMTLYFMIDGRVIGAPEELSDVRGLVTSDYQNELQSRWEEELKGKYPVSVNKKVLRSVKSDKR